MKEQASNRCDRQRAVWLLIGLLGAGVLLVCAAQAQSGDASRLYVAGRRAVLDARWNEAVLYLTAAVDRQPREGGEVVVYGKHLEPYLPHFLLGVAFYELGALDAASKAWRESENQGFQSEVLERRHKTLAELLQRYGSSLAAAEALEQSEKALDVLRESALKGSFKDRASALSASHLEQRRVFEGEVEAAVAEAKRLRATLSTASDSTVGDRALALLSRVEQLAEREEQMTDEEMRAHRRRMAAEIRAARCEGAAIDHLLDQLYGAGGAEQLASSLLPGLIERCGLSGELMIAAARHPSLFDALGRMVEGEGERGAPPFAGDVAVRQDLELLSERACHRPAMARLARWLGGKALERVPARTIERALASAFESCGEPEIAATYQLSESTGRPAADVGGAAAPPASDPASVEARGELELRLDAGVCDPSWRQGRQTQSGTELDDALSGARLARNCGRPDDVAAYLGPAMADGPAASGRRAEILQSLADWYRQQAAADFYSSRHALIFAASDYSDGARGWPDLPGAGGDAEAVRAALLTFGFEEPQLVRDPSGRQMRREMERFIKKYADDGDGEDRLLLVYWAGHGAVLDGQYGDAVWSTGFLVPVDAPYPHAALDPDSSFTRRAVSMDVLEQWAKEMRSRHALFMLDSCYSGSAFRAFGRAESTPRVRRLNRRHPSSEKWDPLARYRLPARLVVASSSADQRAADRSQFRRSFVDWLETPALADYRRDRVVSGNELCLHLAESTREASGGRQSPSCQSLAAPWDQGDIIFPATRSSPAAVSRWVQLHLLADLATWRTAQGDGSPEAWAEYLRHYPAGRFASLAEQRLAAGLETDGR